MGISSSLGSSALLPAGLGFRNKVINGDMRIAQRGTSAITGSGSAQYPVDRWIALSSTTNSITYQQVADAPAGFTYSVKATSGASGSSYSASNYTFLYQKIEGFNIADLAWGTASAKPVSVSFWVKVSSGAVGTYSLCLESYTGTMNYIATYTVNSANTWEYKTIFVPGPTSGSFPVDNTIGLQIDFTLGVGSSLESAANVWTSSAKYAASGSVDLGSLSSATWQITGVQLEQNYQPTPFEQRPIGIELELCMRYYEDSILPLSIAGSYAAGLGGNTYVSAVFFKVPKRIGVTTINGSTDSPGVLRLWNGVLGTLGSVAIYRGGWAHPTIIGADLSSSFGFSLTTQGSTTDAAMAWFRYAFSAEL